MENTQDIPKLIISSFVKGIGRAYKELTDETAHGEGIEKMEGGGIKISGVSVIVSFSGKYSGRMLLSMDKETALRTHNELTGEEEKEITDEVLFTIAELGNMVSGNSITIINEEIDASLRLAPPSVFSGDIRFVNFKASLYNVLIGTAYGKVSLNVAFKEEEK